MGKTIPGTRSFHHFVPLSKFEVATKRLSEEEMFTLKFQFKQGEAQLEVVEIAVSKFVLFTSILHGLVLCV